jgi:glutathione synthase/RimK-type ligase-like ATP-grasp enzyme
MADPGDFVIDADLGVAPFEAIGWHVDVLPWRTERVDWRDYDAVYIGTPWDYPDNVGDFVDTLESIDASGPVLVNPLELVRWNLDKRYLGDLEARGADIVPTVWLDGYDGDEVVGAFDAWPGENVVIKPRVGANAADTFVLDGPPSGRAADELRRLFDARPCMLQPFISAVCSEGEYSLFFFDGGLSHAILKTPAAGDFRVQEEHGADIAAVPVSVALEETARNVMRLVDPPPAYARADFVRDADGRFLLMELELIEPSLYLRMDPRAPERFAAAFDRYARRCL